MLSGIGNDIVAFELGKKKLLIKGQLKNLNSKINGIQVMGDRIFVSMISDSVHIFKYR